MHSQLANVVFTFTLLQKAKANGSYVMNSCDSGLRQNQTELYKNWTRPKSHAAKRGIIPTT